MILWFIFPPSFTERKKNWQGFKQTFTDKHLGIVCPNSKIYVFPSVHLHWSKWKPLQ